MNWYTLQIKHDSGPVRSGLTVAFVSAPSAIQAIWETRDTYRVQGATVSIAARKALYKEWNHGNRKINGELI